MKLFNLQSPDQSVPNSNFGRQTEYHVSVFMRLIAVRLPSIWSSVVRKLWRWCGIL
jgi:hypothetical protein